MLGLVVIGLLWIDWFASKTRYNVVQLATVVICLEVWSSSIDDLPLIDVHHVHVHLFTSQSERKFHCIQVIFRQFEMAITPGKVFHFLLDRILISSFFSQYCQILTKEMLIIATENLFAILKKWYSVYGTIIIMSFQFRKWRIIMQFQFFILIQIGMN